MKNNMLFDKGGEKIMPTIFLKLRTCAFPGTVDGLAL
jgi:hypothetical protein